MNRLEIKKCTISELEQAPNISLLLDEYAKEAAIQGLPHPSAKSDIYKHLETLGSIQSFGAFLGNLLIGFITVLSPILPHYCIRMAVAESFFVAKEHRKSGAGLKLLHEAEMYSKELGSPGMLVSAPLGGELEKILPYIGYTETNRVFFRNLAHV